MCDEKVVASHLPPWYLFHPSDASLSGSPPLAEENGRLVQRLAQLQESVWSCEERIQYLESTNAAMAEDLVQKSALIDHYSMRGFQFHDSSASEQVLAFADCALHIFSLHIFFLSSSFLYSIFLLAFILRLHIQAHTYAHTHFIYSHFIHTHTLHIHTPDP